MLTDTKPAVTDQTNVDDTESHDTSFGYDEAGRKTSASGPLGDETWTYDPAGHVLTHGGLYDRNTSYSYDGNGRLTDVTAPDGTSWHRNLDALGLTTDIDANNTLADTFTQTTASGGPSAPDSAKWTTSSGTDGTPQVVDDQLQLATNATDSTAPSLTATDPQSDDFVGLDYSFADTSSANATTLTVAIRQTSGGDRYQLAIPSDSSTATVQKVVSGTTTDLGTFDLPAPADGAPRSLAIQISGTDLWASAWDPADAGDANSFETTDTDITGTGSASVTAVEGVGANTTTVDNFNESQPDGAVPVVNFGYNDDHQLTSETYPDIGSKTWTYTDGRTTQFDQDLPDAAISVPIGYDDAGSINSIGPIFGIGPLTYTYDNAGQLTHDGLSDEDYTYDDLGRRATSTTGGVTTTNSYNDQSELVSSTPDSGPETTYTYDAAGRRLSSTDGTNSATYGYNAEGLLDGHTSSDGTTTSWQILGYDSSGNLAVTAETPDISVDDTYTQSLIDWDASATPEPIGLLDESHDPSGDLDAATSTSIVQSDTGPVARRTGPTVAALAEDMFGNLLAADPTTADTVATDGGYDAYGIMNDGPSTTTGASTDLPRLGYGGEVTVGTLVDLRARTYDPTTGSFLTQDPLPDAAGTPTIGNPYHYAGNDPLDEGDPTGQRATDTSGSLDVLSSATTNPACNGSNTAAYYCDGRIGPPPPGAAIEDLYYYQYTLNWNPRDSRQNPVPSLANRSAAVALMAKLQADPERYFPFGLDHEDFSSSIKLGARICTHAFTDSDLTKPLSHVPGLHECSYVAVVAETQTSFTFEALPGHVQPAYSWIRFRIFPQGSWLILSVHAFALVGSPKKFYSSILDNLTGDVWAGMDLNLNRDLFGLAGPDKVRR